MGGRPLVPCEPHIDLIGLGEHAVIHGQRLRLLRRFQGSQDDSQGVVLWAPLQHILQHSSHGPLNMQQSSAASSGENPRKTFINSHNNQCMLLIHALYSISARSTLLPTHVLQALQLPPACGRIQQSPEVHSTHKLTTINTM